MKIVIKNGPPAFGDIIVRSIPYCIEVNQSKSNNHFHIYGDTIAETIEAILKIKKGDCTPFFNAKFGRRLPTFHVKRGGSHLLIRHPSIVGSAIFIDLDNVGLFLDALLTIEEFHDSMQTDYRNQGVN